jgi:hypothetical protein
MLVLAVSTEDKRSWRKKGDMVKELSAPPGDPKWE